MSKLKKAVSYILVLCMMFSVCCSAVSAAKPIVGTTTNIVYGRISRSKMYVYRKDVITACSIVSNKHSKDVTNTWAKTDNYTITKSMSNTVSAQGSVDLKIIGGLGLSSSIQTSKGVSISIPANPKKYSKITLRADFYKVDYTRYWYNRSGKRTKTKKYTMYIPIPGTAEYHIKYR